MMKDENVHALKFRESKASQGDAAGPVADLFRLEGRTIIITGATGFLGTTVAAAVMESGADVVALDIMEKPPASSADWNNVTAAAERFSRKLTYHACDVTSDVDVSAAFAALVPELRHPVRSLVACAGVSDNGPSTSFPTSNVRRLLNINVGGTFSVCQAVANECLRTGETASLVLVASMSGYVSNKGVDTAAYNSSKAAVHQLARSLAAEWGSRKGMPLLRVNSLSPGYIRTAATAEALKKPGMESQWSADNMLYRLSTADEFRAPVMYLLGDGSSFMTGADLRVDGGHCAW